MAVPVGEFVRGINAGDDGDHLVQHCLDAGLETAIDVAMVGASMHEELIGDDPHLVELLIACVTQAKMLVNGWAVG